MIGSSTEEKLRALFSLFPDTFNAVYAAGEVRLKPRQPNWRPQVVENYVNGSPDEVLFTMEAKR